MPDYYGMIKELLDERDGMTPWELQFIDSILSPFSDGQKEKIQQIWDKVFG